MTYRNKLRLKRFLIGLGIAALVIAVALLIGFSYLGRYVVYTEDGAYFSFRSQPPAETEAGLAAAQPQVSPVLVTGSAIEESSALEEEGTIKLRASEVQGLLLSYETLQDPAAVDAVDLSESDYNTLVLEMRKDGSAILRSDAISSLLQRASGRGIRLTALISCLDDSAFALEHMSDALPIAGGALWMDESGSYFLDPTSEVVEDYLVSMIGTLTDMGFQEVILDNYYFPETLSVVYDTGEYTRAQLLQNAYESLEEAVGIQCTLGLLVRDPGTGHQAFDLAEHLYVCFSGGAGLRTYVEDHPDYYMVFLTDSHDTRFDGNGKITTESDMSTGSYLSDEE